jgi:hypothetical protein
LQGDSPFSVLNVTEFKLKSNKKSNKDKDFGLKFAQNIKQSFNNHKNKKRHATIPYKLRK